MARKKKCGISKGVHFKMLLTAHEYKVAKKQNYRYIHHFDGPDFKSEVQIFFLFWITIIGIHQLIKTMAYYNS